MNALVHYGAGADTHCLPTLLEQDMKLEYLIDGAAFEVDASSEKPPSVGKDVILTELFGDLTKSQSWYEEGFTVLPLFEASEFAHIKSELSRLVETRLKDLGVDTRGFELEKYHHFVDDDLHYQIVGMTRELFPRDFGFSTEDILNKLESMLNETLGYQNPITGETQWIIIRIIRPGSNDFNPVHKDIYEEYDEFSDVPLMVNFWIPVCGVHGSTGLPVSPASHLLSESRILRFPAGSTVNGKRYRVNNIVEWDGQRSLTTVAPEPGEVLVFSSHLIHGLGRNLNPDTTRISFEFRLFRDAE